MKKFLQKIAGYNPELLKLLPEDLSNIVAKVGASIFIPVVLAFIGGMEISYQFNLPFVFRLFAGFGLALFFFFVDSLLLGLSSLGGNILLYLRLLISFSMCFLISLPTPIMLAHNKIENYLLEKTQNERETATAAFDDKMAALKEEIAVKEERKQQSMTNVVDESMTGKGEKYLIKREKFEKDSVDYKLAKLEYDSIVKVNNDLLGQKINYINQKKSADYYSKVEAMFAIAFKGDILMLVYLFVMMGLLASLEAIPLIYKSGLKKADEAYRILNKQQEELHLNNSNILLQRRSEIELQQKTLELEKNEKELSLKAELLKKKILLDKAEQKIKWENNKIKLQEMLKNKDGFSKKTVEDIFKDEETAEKYHFFDVSKPMNALISKLKKFPEHQFLHELYKWTIANIAYDEQHSQEFYRTAKQVYNEKRAVCGEFTIFMMAILKSIGVETYFIEVTEDEQSKKVSHACLGIKRGHNMQMIDPAYKSFDIYHKKFRVVALEELQTRFKNWNQ